MATAIAAVVAFAWRASRRMSQTEAIIQANTVEIERLRTELVELKAQLAGITKLEVRVAKLEVISTEALDRLKTIQGMLLEERRSQ